MLWESRASRLALSWQERAHVTMLIVVLVALCDYSVKDFLLLR